MGRRRKKKRRGTKKEDWRKKRDFFTPRQKLIQCGFGVSETMVSGFRLWVGEEVSNKG